MERMRFRLQRRETVAMPNILGGHSFPVYTYRWRDIAISNDKEALEEIAAGRPDYRVIDTEE